MSQFQSSLQSLQEVLQAVSPLQDDLEKAASMAGDALLAGNKLMFCGNGGSASEAAHMATEFTCRFKEDRRPYPAMAFTVDAGLLTAIGNDYDFTEVFARQVAAFGKPGDVLIVITSSGKSRNILAALEEARRQGVHTVALLGKGGGLYEGRRRCGTDRTWQRDCPDPRGAPVFAPCLLRDYRGEASPVVEC